MGQQAIGAELGANERREKSVKFGVLEEQLDQTTQYSLIAGREDFEERKRWLEMAAEEGPATAGYY